MTRENRLAHAIETGEKILTAEYLPRTSTDCSDIESIFSPLSDRLTAVNVADNPHGIVMSSLAGSVVLGKLGIEPVYQSVTRDRNRIALQSDVLGAACLGIRNILCMSGRHQTLTGCPESANVYDIDSIQFIAAVRKMNDEGLLLDGTKIETGFSLLPGAAANPYMEPLELNLIRLTKKVDAGARFVQTGPVFDTAAFAGWFGAAEREGITDKTAILAGILPLTDAGEAEKMRDSYTDVSIPDEIIDRLKEAGGPENQKREGLAICSEIIGKIRDLSGLRGIHIFSGGKEDILPELIKMIRN